MLRISYEYLDKSGSYKDSNIRAEITGFRAVQEYCKSNDITKLLNSDQYSTSVKFVKKIPVFKDNKRVQDVDFFDFEGKGLERYRADLNYFIRPDGYIVGIFKEINISVLEKCML